MLRRCALGAAASCLLVFACGSSDASGPATSATTDGGADGDAGMSMGGSGGAGDSGADEGDAGGGKYEVPPVSPAVQAWKDRFDAEWIDDDQYPDREMAIAYSESANVNQEYYYLGYFIDGLTQIWQATGDVAYLDTALSLIRTTMDDAVDVGNGFRGWPSAGDGTEYALWDSFYWRFVATLTRVMHQSPTLREIPEYQQAYEDLLAFSEQHIWARYESYGLGNFYRSRTHMASHWARIGMELFLVTGKPKYKEVFDNISFGTMVNRPSNLRNQIFANPSVPTAYLWDQEWGVPEGTALQDTSHGGAVVSFWVLARQNGMYWKQDDITALLSTLNDVVWKASNASEFHVVIDGTGGFDLPGRLNEWLTLGRFDQSLQDRIEADYVTSDNLVFFGTQTLGIAGLNEKILDDGQPVWPEPETAP